MEQTNTKALIKKFEDQIKEELSKMTKFYDLIANRYTEENTEIRQTKNGKEIEKKCIDLSASKKDIRENHCFWDFIEHYEGFWNNYQKVLNAKNLSTVNNDLKEVILGYTVMNVFVEGFHNGQIRKITDFNFLTYLLNKFGYDKEQQATIITLGMRSTAISTNNQSLPPSLFQAINKDGSFNSHVKVLEVLISIVIQLQDYEVQKIIFNRFYNESMFSDQLDSSQKVFLKLNYQLGLEILEGIKIIADYLKKDYDDARILFLNEFNKSINEYAVTFEKGMMLKYNSQKEKMTKPCGPLVDKAKEVSKFVSYIGINTHLLKAFKDCKPDLVTFDFVVFAELFKKYQNFSVSEQARVLMACTINLIKFIKFTTNVILEQAGSIDEILAELYLPFNQKGLIIKDNALIGSMLAKLGFSSELAKELIKIRDTEQMVHQSKENIIPEQKVSVVDKTVNYAKHYIEKYYDGKKIIVYVDNIEKFKEMLVTARYEKSVIEDILKLANSFNSNQDELAKTQKKELLKENILADSEKKLIDYCTNILKNYYNEYSSLSDKQCQIVQGFITGIKQNPELGYSIIKEQPDTIQKSLLIQEIKTNLEDLNVAFEMYSECPDEILLDEIALIIKKLDLLSQMFALFLPKEISSEELYNIRYLSSVLNYLPQKMIVSEKRDAETLLFKLKQGIGTFDLPTYDGKAFYKLNNSMCVYYTRGKNNSILIIGLVRRESKGFTQYDKIISRDGYYKELIELQTTDEMSYENNGKLIEDIIVIKSNNLVTENTIK